MDLSNWLIFRCLVISSVAASSAFPITGCSPLLISCPQCQRPSLRHIYFPPSVTLVQAVVILIDHHLILPELPAPAMSSPSSLLCCPPSVLCYLCLTPQLIPSAPVGISCRLSLFGALSILSAWSLQNSLCCLVYVGLAPSHASATASSAVSPIQHSY